MDGLLTMVLIGVVAWAVLALIQGAVARGTRDGINAARPPKEIDHQLEASLRWADRIAKESAAEYERLKKEGKV